MIAEPMFVVKTDFYFESNRDEIPREEKKLISFWWLDAKWMVTKLFRSEPSERRNCKFPTADRHLIIWSEPGC